MADIAQIYITNGTNGPLVGAVTHKYQMDTWQFGTIGHENFQAFSVKFHNGKSDEDDSGEAMFAMNGVNYFELDARSGDHSEHYFEIRTQKPGNKYIVVGTCGTSAVQTAPSPTGIDWHTLDDVAAGTKYQVGPINQNGDILGVALVDLTLLFTNPGDPDTYYSAIQQNNLSFDQAQALQRQLKSLFT